MQRLPQLANAHRGKRDRCSHLNYQLAGAIRQSDEDVRLATLDYLPPKFFRFSGMGTASVSRTLATTSATHKKRISDS